MMDNQADLNQLILMLGEAGIRETIPSKLHQFDGTAVKPLLDALQSPDEELRLGVVWAIGQVTNSVLGMELNAVAVEPLLALLQDDSAVNVRLQSLKTLTSIVDPSQRETLEAALIAALNDSGESIRAEAARWLGQYTSEAALEPLRELALNDSSTKVRSRAAYALAYIEPGLETLNALGKPGYETLLAALSDNELSVRLRVIWALGQMKSVAAIRSLANIVESETANYHEKQTAAEALGNIGDNDAIDTLVTAMQFDRHEGVRAAAAEAVGKLGNRRSVQFLIHALHDDVELTVRASAAKGLKHLGETSATEPLIVALSDSSTDVRFRAVEALEVVGDARAVEALEQLIADEQNGKQVRQAAERTLAALTQGEST